MPSAIPRRAFLAGAPTAAASAALLELGFPATLLAERGARQEASPPASFPRQSLDEVRAVVGASHAQLDRVIEVVEARAALAKASWDWGFGDWESALGAASHMGRRDIAEFLMEHGARANIFTFAMLGAVDGVEALVATRPGVQRTHGPHGITLLQHVRNRMSRDGLSAQEEQGLRDTLRFLEEVGGADDGQPSLELRPGERERYLGTYRFGPNERDVVEILVHQGRDMLAMDPAAQGARVLNRVERHGFAPNGAPAVRVRFEVIGGEVRSLTIHDPVPLLRALRDG